jgi:hypothetical protein
MKTDRSDLPALMLLEAHVVTWLREGLRGPVDERDLDRTYAFEHPLNAQREIARQSIQRPPGAPESFLWHVRFYVSVGQEVLNGPLARKLYPRAALWSDPGTRGVVAYNARLVLREELRGRGFARSVYTSEHDPYSRWGVREIQTRAEDQGPLVWVKAFGFQPKQPELLAEQYRAWAIRNARPAEPPSDPRQYPAPFLSTCHGLMLYKVLE